MLMARPPWSSHPARCDPYPQPDMTRESPTETTNECTPSLKRKRTRSGCLNCRRKKRKCDEAKPSCSRCTRVNELCQWGVRVGFRPMNPSASAATPGQSVQSCLPPASANFEIVDLTRSIILEHARADKASSSSPGQASPSVSQSASGPETTQPLDEDPPPSALVWTTPEMDVLASDSAQHSSPVNGALERHHATLSPQTEHAFAAANLLSLREQVVPDPGGLRPAPVAADHVLGSAFDVDSLAGAGDTSAADTFLSDYGYILNTDGSLLPGPRYFGLHTTLRDRLIQESQSNLPSRPGSPGRDCGSDDGAQIHTNSVTHIDRIEQQGDGGGTLALKPEEEYQLWKNWLDEVCPWLDKFDRHEHFRLSVSNLAGSHLHVKYSIMAVSARQMERQKGSQGLAIPSSLALYQQAIHHLLPQLATRSTAVIASCVLLCVLEMLSSSPKAWQRHLDGCATLLQAVGIHGFSGGVDQALFWCFVRMDLAGGLISSTKPLIPVRLWTPEPLLSGALSLFCSYASCDVYANQMVYLTAHLVELLEGSVATTGAAGTFSRAPKVDGNDRDDPSVQSWQELVNSIEQWYERRPFEMEPVFSTPTGGKSFPTILFSNPAAISGNQMYHTAALLLSQHRPPQVKLPAQSRSILWHARRIIGISLSNTHHGCWTNSLQPIWIAGRCFSSPEEHSVILGLLSRIEAESGWATKWRADDLREWWGDLGD